MAYQDDLPEHAAELVSKDDSTQADLRRAVSAAYYALFHLLISETVANWSLATSRDGLARMFEHGLMAKASDRVLNEKVFPFVGANLTAVQELRAVAKAFVALQEMRHTADYDNAAHWTRTQARGFVRMAVRAFDSWKLIKWSRLLRTTWFRF